MAQVMTFPREFNRGLFAGIERDFIIISTIIYLALIIVTLSLQNLKPSELSEEQIARFQQVIYRVKPAPVVRRETKTEAAVGEAAPVEEVVEQVEEKPVTEEDKEVKREKEKAQRSARQELRRERAKAAAERMKILAGPTARGRRVGSAADAARSLGLASGNVGGFDVKEMVGIVGDAGTAEKVKKVRGAGAISAEIGEIDIAELRAMKPSDLDKMLSEAPIELNRAAITAKGKGAASAKRNQSAISEIVIQNKNQIQYCYWTYKKRDSSLRGRVVVEFTINPDGNVVRVRFRQSDWGGNPLGAEIERCINNIISSWQFEPIAASEGNVTAGATYIFE